MFICDGHCTYRNVIRASNFASALQQCVAFYQYRHSLGVDKCTNMAARCPDLGVQIGMSSHICTEPIPMGVGCWSLGSDRPLH